jgi:phytoene dehydrogenase-like protein
MEERMPEQNSKIPVSTSVTKFDVIIVGAGYSGLICGAILSRKGMKVLLVDELTQIGGRGGSVNYHGYSIDCAHRDAGDLGDLYMLTMQNGRYAIKAAEAAGAKVAWVGPLDPSLYSHLVFEHSATIVPLTRGPEGADEFASKILELSADEAKRYFAVLERLSKLDYEGYITVTFEDWLPGLKDPAIEKALLKFAKIFFSVPPEKTSVGRFIQAIRDPGELYLCNDAEVGGVQGFMEPFAREIRKNGGVIALGHKPYEILTAGNRVTGIVTRDICSAVQVFEAPHVVFAYPIWSIFSLLKPELLPPDVVKNAKELEKYKGDFISINMGLSRLPKIRGTGEIEQSPIFKRVLRGHNHDYSGGWFLPSLASKLQAPAGKHMLTIAMGTSGEGSADFPAFTTFEEAKSRVEPTLSYVRRYYQDLDEITEWMTYNLVKAPTISEVWRPVRKAPLEAPTLKGLYFAECTTEVDGYEQDIAANAALQTCDLILKYAGKA